MQVLQTLSSRTQQGTRCWRRSRDAANSWSEPSSGGILPRRVCRLDQPDLLRAPPAFDLRLAGDGGDRIKAVMAKER
jgi:hypothetical protein